MHSHQVVKWHDKYKRLYTGDKAGTVFEWDAGIEDYLMKVQSAARCVARDGLGRRVSSVFGAHGTSSRSGA